MTSSPYCHHMSLRRFLQPTLQPTASGRAMTSFTSFSVRAWRVWLTVGAVQTLPAMQGIVGACLSAPGDLETRKEKKCVNVVLGDVNGVLFFKCLD